MDFTDLDDLSSPQGVSNQGDVTSHTDMMTPPSPLSTEIDQDRDRDTLNSNRFPSSNSLPTSSMISLKATTWIKKTH